MRGKAAQDGDTRWSPNGYNYTRVKGKWELTHRLVMEKKLGRPLKNGETVRFKDGDRTNFKDPNNLILKEGSGGSKAKRIATLRARIEELQGQLAELEEYDGPLLPPSYKSKPVELPSPDTYGDDIPDPTDDMGSRRIPLVTVPLSIDDSICIYCGGLATSKDHLLPKNWTGKAQRKYVRTVPACMPCNLILSDFLIPDIGDRIKFVQQRIRERARRKNHNA